MIYCEKMGIKPYICESNSNKIYSYETDCIDACAVCNSSIVGLFCDRVAEKKVV